MNNNFSFRNLTFDLFEHPYNYGIVPYCNFANGLLIITRNWEGVK